MITPLRTPVLGLAAFSGTGKTTLLRRVIPLLRMRGLKLGLIKHSHHSFAIDKPGKDSYNLSRAGAMQTVIASRQRTVTVVNHTANAEPALAQFLQRLDDDHLDLILVEGFKYQPIPKIELHRPSLNQPLLCSHDPFIVAVASDAPLAMQIAIPILDLNNPAIIADFIQDATA